MSSTKNISVKALTVSQAKSTMASLHKETSSLSHTAKVEDLFTFSSLLGDAEAFHLDEIRDAYDADLAGTGTIWAEEPPVRDLWRAMLKANFGF